MVWGGEHFPPCTVNLKKQTLGGVLAHSKACRAAQHPASAVGAAVGTPSSPATFCGDGGLEGFLPRLTLRRRERRGAFTQMSLLYGSSLLAR